MALPKTIYVWEERDSSNEESYLLAHKDESDLNENIIYGIYELKEKKKMVFKREPVKVNLVPNPPAQDW